MVWNFISTSSNFHYDDVIMTMLASQITSLPVVCSIVYSDVNQRKHQSSASLAFVREIHRGPVNFPHKWPVTRKMFPFDDVIMQWRSRWVLVMNKLFHPTRVISHPCWGLIESALENDLQSFYPYTGPVQTLGVLFVHWTKIKIKQTKVN